LGDLFDEVQGAKIETFTTQKPERPECRYFILDVKSMGLQISTDRLQSTPRPRRIQDCPDY